MNATDWLVVMGGLAAIAWVNGYFFLAGRTVATAAVSAGGMQEVTIGVHGGYEPSQVRVKAGAPVRLVLLGVRAADLVHADAPRQLGLFDRLYG